MPREDPYLSERSWIMAQTWRDLLFAHWPVSWAAARALVPADIELDRWDGNAWLGVVPFRMTGIRPRGVPALPYLSDTLELNVRTYVTVNGKPGVYFFSLDAERPLAVSVARRFFHLPYYNAAMSCLDGGSNFDYASRRTHRDAPEAELRAWYRPAGPVAVALEGSLEHFLTARFCLFTTDDSGSLWRGDIEHEPWPLQPAHAEIITNTMARPLGFELVDKAASLLYSRRVDVKIRGLALC